MDEMEFTRAYLGEHKTRGDEIIAKTCPFCHGGQHGDKWTFSINQERHVFKCMRGSCGAQGHFNQLLQHFGLPINEDLLPEEAGRKRHTGQMQPTGGQVRQVHTPAVNKEYRLPQLPHMVTEGPEMEYIRSRGITPETCAAFGVGGTGAGEIVFPYYESREEYECQKPTFVKYRPARKLDKGERKARREKDARPVLLGMHLCDTGNGTLYIFEGEFDCMAAWQVHGGNCVSVPSGCQDFTWLETCTDFLGQYDTVAVIGDNDAPGREMIERLADKLDCKVLTPDFARYGACKDANEFLYRHGAERMRQEPDSVHPVPTLGLLNLADVKGVDLSQLPRVLSGIGVLNMMTGGMYLGDLTVWTGRRGEGKSTLLTQEMLEAIDQGYNVCVYSGEITSERFKQLAYLQAAGTAHVCDRTDEQTGRVNQFVSRGIMEQIDRWMDGRYWLYDNRIAEADEADSILDVMEKAYKRYDCRVFLVDNLMTVRTSQKENDFYQQQAAFALKLQKFARTHQVLVHLVAHPRKTGGRAVMDNDDIGGLGTITNIADTVLVVHRADEEERGELGCDSTVKVLKNRATGILDEIGLFYLPRPRRFVAMGEVEKSYGWEQLPASAPQELEEPPF